MSRSDCWHEVVLSLPRRCFTVALLRSRSSRGSAKNAACATHGLRRAGLRTKTETSVHAPLPPRLWFLIPVLAVGIGCMDKAVPAGSHNVPKNLQATGSRHASLHLVCGFQLRRYTVNNMPHSQPPLVLDKDLEAAVPTPRLDGTTLR